MCKEKTCPGYLALWAIAIIAMVLSVIALCLGFQNVKMEYTQITTTLSILAVLVGICTVGGALIPMIITWNSKMEYKETKGNLETKIKELDKKINNIDYEIERRVFLALGNPEGATEKYQKK